MGFVDYCISAVVDGACDISPYMLRLAFDNPVSGHGYPSWVQIENDSNYSIEQGIREKIIYKMMGSLMNVVGGSTELIDLSQARVEYMGNGHMHVNVPDALTGGREIVSVINVYPGNLGASLMYGGSNTQTCGNGQIQQSMNSIVNNLSGNNIISGFYETTKTGRNSFLIRSSGVAIYSLAAKVILSYDEEFSIISSRAYPYFGEWCIMGTKAYIYRNCRRGLKEAVIKYGYPLDELQDEIDEYRGSYAEFTEYFHSRIRKTMAYADSKSVSDAIAMITPRRIG